MIVASIDKFYSLIVGKSLNIRHLYPSRKKHELPKYLTRAEVKRMLPSIANPEHACIISPSRLNHMGFKAIYWLFTFL
ncbi:MAG: hypothetical protein WC946_05735 [Bacteroidales bacterium]|jgi:integrase/recombinase XerD